MLSPFLGDCKKAKVFAWRPYMYAYCLRRLHELGNVYKLIEVCLGTYFACVYWLGKEISRKGLFSDTSKMESEAVR